MTDTATPQARTLRFQKLANRIVRTLLATPLLGRLLGRRLMTLYVVGRRSGTRYVLPVAYHVHDGRLLVGTSFAWARNLRSGDEIDVRLRARRRRAVVTVISDENGVVADYATIARANRQFAGFNAITFDAQGEPEPADLHRSWAQGARVLRLVLR